MPTDERMEENSLSLPELLEARTTFLAVGGLLSGLDGLGMGNTKNNVGAGA